MVEIRYTGDALKAVNPNRQVEEDTRTPEERLDFIEAKQKEIMEALAVLHSARQCLEQNLLVAAVKEKEMNSDSPTWMVHEIL